MLFWRGRFGLAAFSDYARADLVAGEGRAQFLIQPIPGIMTAWVTAITIPVGTCTIAPIGITISIVTGISKAAVISTTLESCAEISSNTAVTSVSAASSTAIGYS